jgi:hypothetical protein
VLCTYTVLQLNIGHMGISSSSAFSLYPGGNAYVTAFNFPPFRWPHSVFEEGHMGIGGEGTLEHSDLTPGLCSHQQVYSYM